MRGAQLPAFELKTAVKNGRFQYASLPKAVTDINLSARVANPGGVMDRTVVELSNFGLKMAGNALSASFYGTNLVSDPQLRAAVRGEVDLGAVKEVYPLEEMELQGLITADLRAAGRLSDVEKQRYNNLTAAGTFVVPEEQRSDAVALTQSLCGLAGFLSTVVFGVVVGAVQRGGNLVWGLPLYAQHRALRILVT